jgi:hypothetical protein
MLFDGKITLETSAVPEGSNTIDEVLMVSSLKPPVGKTPSLVD